MTHNAPDETTAAYARSEERRRRKGKGAPRLRRGVLLLLFATGCADTTTIVGLESARSYVLSCQKPAGGFGPRLQPYADVDWTYYAVSALSLLGEPVPDADRCARSLPTHDAQLGSVSRQGFLLAATRSLLGDTRSAEAALRLRSLQRSDGGWCASSGVATLPATYWAVAALAALQTAAIDGEAAGRFVIDRLHPDGHFDDVTRSKLPPDRAGAAELGVDGARSDGGHVWLTYCGVTALTMLGYEVPWKQAIVSWLRSCQQADGGFSWRPGLDSLGGSDIWYTYLAVEALRTLGAMPADSVGATEFINACQNADGGFGDRPGWSSRLAATYYALSAAKSLSFEVARAIRPKAVPRPRYDPPSTWRGMRFYSAYQGPTTGGDAQDSAWSPGLLVYSMGTGLDDAEPYLRAPALAIGDTLVERVLWELHYPEFVSSLDDGKLVVRSLGFWIESCPRPDTMQAIREAWSAICATGSCDTVEGRRFGEQVLQPLVERGVISYERIGTGDQDLDYLLMDELLTRTHGQCGLVGASSDGSDLVRTNPHLERLVGRLPLFVPLAGPSDRARLVWLGRSGDPDDLRAALRDGRTACVIREGGASDEMVIYAEPRMLAALRHRSNEVRWWKAGGP